MKNAFLKILSIFVVGCLFFSCDPSTGNDSGEDTQQQKQEQQQQQEQQETPEKTEEEKTDNENTKPTLNRNFGVTFDFSGAQALAKLEAKKDGSRAVTNADDLGDLVKILADGSMENAITVGENCSLSDIIAIYKSPLEESKDIFIVFNGESVLGYEEVEKEYDWGETYTDRQEIRVGQLICLHEDGSIADILKKDNPTEYWNTHMSLKTESVTFDAVGNLYFISSDNGDMIYQFDPKTNELVKMVAAVENTTYNKMQIDDEGQWIFVSGSRYTGSNSYFLRAIPINNPNSPVNIYFSSNNGISSNNWVYDNSNGKMYFIVDDGGKAGLFTATKTGGFRDKTFYHSYIGEGFENVLFESFYASWSVYEWSSNACNENNDFDPTIAVENIINCIESFYDEKTHSSKRLTKDDVDIRFDKYFSAQGSLKALAFLTQGMKNEEAFEALNNPIGMAALLQLRDYPNYSDCNNWFKAENGFKHNFLADILYFKDTDILLVDSNDVIFTYAKDYMRDDNNEYIYVYNEDTEQYEPVYQFEEVRSVDLFKKNTYGNYIDVSMISFVNAVGSPETEYTYSFNQSFYNPDGKLNVNSVLETLFDNCNNIGTKYFSLSDFKNDVQYGNLFTELTNGDAIEWIASSPNRMNLFGQLSGISSRWIASDNRCVTEIKYSSFMNMISKTCLIEGSKQKALTWNWEPQNNEIIYYGSWYGINCKLSASATGIYYEYYNTSGTDPYYYIVQVVDSDGKFVELVNKLPLPSGKVVKSEKNKDRIILQYSMMDENGAELGYHHIYSVEMANGLVTNCFDNVPNRNNLEVVTFNSAGDLLYYSAVRGTLVENGIVNILTNEYNPLSVQRKMVAVYTFN